MRASNGRTIKAEESFFRRSKISNVSHSGSISPIGGVPFPLKLKGFTKLGSPGSTSPVTKNHQTQSIKIICER